MRSVVENILSTYENTSEGNWLTQFNWRAVKVKAMPFVKPGLIMAMYVGPFNTVWLEDLTIASDPFNIWATDVIHEFYHAYQYHTMGPIKYLFTKVFNRKKLEEDAVNASLTWLNKDIEVEQWIIK